MRSWNLRAPGGAESWAGSVVSGCCPNARDDFPNAEVDAFMGIDQVTQVTGSSKAIAHRAERLQAGIMDAPSGKSFRTLPGWSATTSQPTGKKHSGHSESWPCACHRHAIRAPAGGQCSAQLHSGLCDASLSPHAAAFCLSQDRRRLQPSMQFLHHSADARRSSQSHSGRYRAGGAATDCRRCSRTELDFADDLLRPRSARSHTPRHRRRNSGPRQIASG